MDLYSQEHFAFYNNTHPAIFLKMALGLRANGARLSGETVISHAKTAKSFSIETNLAVAIAVSDMILNGSPPAIIPPALLPEFKARP